jgi:hypothetical protein
VSEHDVVLVHEDGPLTELLRGIIAKEQGKTVKFIKKVEVKL